jgi:plastocyanin
MKRLTTTLGLLALAAFLAACSGASADQGTPTQPAGSPSGPSVSIVAKDIAFVQSAVTVTAGTPFQIAFDNKDGAPHNVAIADAAGGSVFKGEIVSGKQATYQVPALAAGTYTFICEVHPNMKGTITAR